MKWVKWITISLILAIIALFIYQNLPVFNSSTTFILDLHFREFQWSLQLYAIFGIGALLGFILGILLMLKPHLKVRRRLFEERQAKQELQQKQQPQEKTQTTDEAQVPAAPSESMGTDKSAVGSNADAGAVASSDSPAPPTEAPK